MGKYSLLTCLLSIVSLLDVSVSNAEPCQAPNTAYSGIYTCVDPAIVLADPAIQCDPETCLWNLDLFNPEQPPEPCLAILLLEQQIANLPDLLEPCLWWEMLHGDLGYLLPEELPSAVASPSPSPLPTFIGESRRHDLGFVIGNWDSSDLLSNSSSLRIQHALLWFYYDTVISAAGHFTAHSLVESNSSPLLVRSGRDIEPHSCP